MKPAGLQYRTIDEIQDFVTAIDRPDLPENYCTRIRGLRTTRPKIIGERDWGTKHMYSTYPSGITIVDAYFLYSTTDNKEYCILVGVDGSGYTRIYVDDGAGGGAGNWSELTRIVKSVIDVTPSASSCVATLKSLNDIQDNHLASVALDELIGYTAINMTRGVITVVESNAVSTGTSYPTIEVAVTCHMYLGADGALWQAGDVVWLYQSNGFLDEVNDRATLTPTMLMNGLTPHIRWMEITGLDKVHMYWGDSSNPTVTRIPIQIHKSGTALRASYTSPQEIYFYPRMGKWNSTLVHQFKLDATHLNNRWDSQDAFSVDLGAIYGYIGLIVSTNWSISKAHLIPFFKEREGATAAVPDTVGNEVSTEIGEGIRIRSSFAPTGTGNYYRLYVTVLYRGKEAGSFYQESDPIYQYCYEAGIMHGITVSADLNFGLLNKMICGFRLYEAAKFSSVTPVDPARWLDDASEYLLVQETLLDRTADYSPNLTQNKNDPYSYSIVIRSRVPPSTTGPIGVILTTPIGVPDLYNTLGHAISKKRSYLKPRYAVKAARPQGSAIVLDEDDQTLRVSAYNGAGAHMDGSYPNVTYDIALSKQKVFLSGLGEMYGLGMRMGKVVVLRRAEKEIIDLGADSQRIEPGDCVAKKSIIGMGTKDESVLGLVWAGQAGIYLMPWSGSQDTILNPLWQNLYNGELFTDTTNVPYVNDVQRQEVIIGYDKNYQELWVQVPCSTDTGTAIEYLCFRTNFRKWFIRKLNITGEAAKFFRNTKDGKFVIGCASGLLMYPNRSFGASSHAYEDEVSYTGVSAGKGIETMVRMNLGSLYSLSGKFIIYDMFLDHKGTVSANAKGQIDFYDSGQDIAYDTKTFPINSRAVRRGVFRRGPVRKAEVDIQVTDRLDCRDFEISKMEIGVIPAPVQQER